MTANQEISRADIDGNKLVFTPAANANGSNYASFTFKVNDGTAESASSYTMTIDVSAVNDPPTASSNTVTTNEDTAYTFDAGDFRFSDVDAGAALAKVKIVTPPGAGTLARSGTAVTANQEISRADIDGNKLVFTPAANANGSNYASFTFKVNDGTAESASSYTMTIDVSAVNDPPTASSNTVTTNEDTAYTFDAGDFRFSDVDAGAALAKVKIVTPPGAGTLARSGTAVTTNQEISRADIDGNKLVFTPAANANGSNYASFTFKVNDGTAESASSYTMTIDVSAVNDPPTASSNTVTTNEDTAYTFDAGDFRFSDVDAGAALAKVKIVTPPGAGTLARSGTAVTANQEISRADIDGDKLVFTPAANANGSNYASFTFKVNDGTAESASSYTMTIDVSAVNDPPTASSNTVTTNEDTAYTFDGRRLPLLRRGCGRRAGQGEDRHSAGGGHAGQGRHRGDRQPGDLQSRHRRQQAGLHPGRERQRRFLCQLHLQGERRHRRERLLLHHDHRRVRGERPAHGLQQRGRSPRTRTRPTPSTPATSASPTWMRAARWPR